ncbi:HD domain-containing phosphohydrolase [Virgibacillus halophilus]|uniref:HD domain-containing phosphohydrolase n=2 Tax=Tigheibacillus halophilus TaxID=361280 RepID=A0ABU5C680_9BACI|nr:HD domain-containing phosphohydrolase [Virgibacillus halophilus]
MAGLLCDAGLAKMPENLSTYGAKRRQGGESLLRQHPVYSYRMIEKVPGLHRLSKLAVLQHHERIDGSGYPIGLTADKLHLYSKIIAVCDTYYNLRCNYPDRSPYKLMEDMKQDEFTRLDPGIMKKMMQSFPDLSVGSMVLLSNGKRAKVMFKEPNAPIRPIVSVTDNEEIISLKDRSSIWIEQKLTANE